MNPIDSGRILYLHGLLGSSAGQRDLNMLVATLDDWQPAPGWCNDSHLIVSEWRRPDQNCASGFATRQKRYLPDYINSFDALYDAEMRQGLHTGTHTRWLYRVWQEAMDYVSKLEKDPERTTHSEAFVQVQLRAIAFVYTMEKLRYVLPCGFPGAENTQKYFKSEEVAQVGDEIFKGAIEGRAAVGRLTIVSFSEDGKAVALGHLAGYLVSATISDCTLAYRRPKL